MYVRVLKADLFHQIQNGVLKPSMFLQVEAGFSQATRCYEIRSRQGCRKFQQAFLCYGPHDNQKLLLEYGFVSPGNPHSVVYVDPSEQWSTFIYKKKSIVFFSQPI